MNSSEKWIHRIAWAALLVCLAFLLVCSLCTCRTAKNSQVSSSMEAMAVDSCSFVKVDSVSSIAEESVNLSSLRIDSIRFVAMAVNDDSLSSDKVPPWKPAIGQLLNSAVAYGIRLDVSSFDWSLKSDSVAKNFRAFSRNFKESTAQQQSKQTEPKDNKTGQIFILCFIIVAFIAMAKVFFNADKL